MFKLILFYFLSIPLLFAQELYRKKLPMESINNYEIYDLLEDSVGRLIIATDNGILRYDGYSLFKYKQQEESNVKDYFSLTPTKNGNLLCTDIYGGIYKIKNDSVLRIYKFNINTEKHPSLKKFNNKIYFNAKFYNKKVTDKIKPIQIGKDTIFIEHAELFLIYKDQKVKKENYKLYFDGANYSNFLPKYSDLSYLNATKDFISIQFSESNSVFLWKDSANYQFRNDLIKNQITSPNLLTTNNYCIYRGGKDDNFITNSSFKKLFSSPIKEKFISVFKETKYTNLLYGTLNNGISFFPNLKVKKYSYKQPLQQIQKLNNIIYTTNKESDAFIWTKDTMFNFGKLNFYPHLKETYGYKNNILFSSDGAAGYILNFYPTKLKFIPSKFYYRYTKNHNVFGNIKQIYCRTKSSNDFTNKFNAQQSNVHSINTFSLNVDRYSDFYFDKKKENLFLANVNNLVIKEAFTQKVDTIYKKGNSIYAKQFFETELGLLYTTKDDGFGQIKNKKIKQFVDKNGGYLKSNSIRELEVYKNNVYVCHEFGIQVFDSNFNWVRDITSKIGFKNNNIQDFTIKEDTMYLLNEGDLYTFSLIEENKKKPNIILSSFKVNSIDKPLNDNLILPYSTNYLIQIGFKGILLVDQENLKYKYRVKEIAENWVDIKINETPSVSFYGLSYGDYTFEVKCISSDRRESVTKEIKFTIKKPFYLQYWFLVLSVLFVSSLVLLIFKRYQLQKKEEEEKIILKKELAESKLSSLRAQMNPHFIFNALNSIQSFIMLNERQTAGKYLSIFSQLIREYLMQSRKSKISIKEELNALNLYLQLEKIRFEDTLNYTIEDNFNGSTETNFIPPLIIQPFVENAIKHGLLHKKGEQLLSIKFKENLKESSLICIIEDNGIGREKSKQINKKKIHKSIGISNTAKRLEILSNNKNKINLKIIDLYDENGSASGTKVELEIPFK